MDAHYHKKGLVLYASKAFCCKRMYRILNEEGLGADVVSGGELYTALQAGFPAERIYFHGNNKTADELTMALESGVGRIVVDNIAELELLGALAKAAGKTASVLFRIKPGIDAHTHNFIRTGQIDSKFGFALETGEALQAVAAALKTPGIRVAGIHCHIGSQIWAAASASAMWRRMIPRRWKAIWRRSPRWCWVSAKQTAFRCRLSALSRDVPL